MADSVSVRLIVVFTVIEWTLVIALVERRSSLSTPYLDYMSMQLFQLTDYDRVLCRTLVEGQERPHALVAFVEWNRRPGATASGPGVKRSPVCCCGHVNCVHLIKAKKLVIKSLKY